MFNENMEDKQNGSKKNLPVVRQAFHGKKELGGKWAAYVVVIQCVVAWIAALITYIIAGIL